MVLFYLFILFYYSYYCLCEYCAGVDRVLRQRMEEESGGIEKESEKNGGGGKSRMKKTKMLGL